MSPLFVGGGGVGTVVVDANNVDGGSPQQG